MAEEQSVLRAFRARMSRVPGGRPCPGRASPSLGHARWTTVTPREPGAIGGRSTGDRHPGAATLRLARRCDAVEHAREGGGAAGADAYAERKREKEGE